MRRSIQLLPPAHCAGVGDSLELPRNSVLEIIAYTDRLFELEVLRRLRIHERIGLDLPRELRLGGLLGSPHSCVNVFRK